MAVDSESEYCLRWKKYEINFRTFFADLYQNEALVDVSLVTQEGSVTSAHRVVLSACSQYFQNIFNNIPNHPHPVIVLKDVSAPDLQSILCFMYKGTVNVLQNRVNGIIAIASSLQVKGLSAAPSPPLDLIGIPPTINNTSPSTPSTQSTQQNSNNNVTTIPPIMKPITITTYENRSTVPTRALPNLRPSPDNVKASQKRKLEPMTSLLSHETELKAHEKETDYYGKPPPLHCQPPQAKYQLLTEKSSHHPIEVKLEHMGPSFSSLKDESSDDDELSDSQFLGVTDGDDGNTGEGFLSNSKTLDSLSENLGGVEFVDDSDYSEALEFVEQDVQFLNEASSSAGQHFMTTGVTGTGQEQKIVPKKKCGSSESRRFKCNTCGNMYAKKSGLTRHMRCSHAGLNSFLCDLCHKSYTRSDILTKHKRRVHNVNNSTADNNAMEGILSSETFTITIG